MTDFERLLRALAEVGVDFLLVGGLAANAPRRGEPGARSLRCPLPLPGARRLIRVKRAAGRPKDFAALAEQLEALREERESR